MKSTLSVTHFKIVILAALCAAPVAAFAETLPSWNCRNMDFEISCSAEGCKAAEAFTPMDIHLSGDEISLCAYTTCWTGAPTAVQSAGGFVSYVGAGLVGAVDASDLMDAAVTIEIASGAASVLVAGRYATPAHCAVK